MIVQAADHRPAPTGVTDLSMVTEPVQLPIR